MERAIGEIFEIEGKKLKVVKSVRVESCEGCYFYLEPQSCIKKMPVIGSCSIKIRTDKKSIIFKLLEE